MPSATAASMFPPVDFDRKFVNGFLNKPLENDQDIYDIRPVDVRPIPGISNRELYGVAAKVADMLYHPNGFDLGAPPEFRSEANQPLTPEATLILAQVAACESMKNTPNNTVCAKAAHAAWVHAWLAVRDEMPEKTHYNKYVRSWADLKDPLKLREALFIQLAYRRVLAEGNALDIAEEADNCLIHATETVNLYLDGESR